MFLSEGGLAREWAEVSVGEGWALGKRAGGLPTITPVGRPGSAPGSIIRTCSASSIIHAGGGGGEAIERLSEVRGRRSAGKATLTSDF
jgi:hypothetical protein